MALQCDLINSPCYSLLFFITGGKRMNLVEHFSTLEDPRILKKCDHKLIDVLVIAVCATLCRFDESWEAIEEFGIEREDWFKKFLELPNGIPSHDTFRRVFLLIDPKEFSLCFVSWANSFRQKTTGEIIGVDGKTLAGSRDSQRGMRGVHIVSAFANENKLVLGQIKVDEKSNEITAIPELLNLLDIKGCTVTIDAMGAQKEIAKKIIEKKADFTLGLKGNQGNLHDDVKTYINDQVDSKTTDKTHQILKTTDADHGRVEERTFHLFTNLKWLNEKEKWSGLSGIGMVEAVVTKGSKTTNERRYFLTSLTEINQFSKSVREHWGIESEHWILDVAFNEDNCVRRKGDSPANSAVLKHIVLNLLRNEKTRKISTNRKRSLACLRLDYLEKIVFG